MMMKRQLALLALLCPFGATGFYIEPSQETILGIPADTLNRYADDPFFKARIAVTSHLNFIPYQAREDEGHIYLPAQGYYDDDPRCCPTELVLKIRKPHHELVAIEVYRNPNRRY